MGTVSGFKRGLKKAGKKKPPPPRQSGGTSGDLTVKDHRPETPTRTYASVEREERKTRRARKVRKKAERAEQNALRILRETDFGPDPQFEHFKARTEGRFPSSELREKYPRAYKRSERAAHEYLDEREGLKEDPLAEAVIGAAAGGVASAGAKLGAKAVSAGAARLAGKGGETALKTAVKKAASKAKAAPAKKVASAKSAPKRAVRRAKETPQRVRTAPKRARKAAATKEGRRTAAKGAGKSAARHPLRSFAGSGVVANQSGADVPALKQAGAFVEGHVDALRENPGKTLETTARAIPGIVTGPAALLGSAGSSAVHGTTEPLEREASKQFMGLKEMGEELLSGDPKRVQKSVEDEVGLSVVAPAPALSRIGRTKTYKAARGKARAKVARKRGATRAKRRGELREFNAGTRAKKARPVRHAVVDTATGEERILRRAGKVIEGHRQRKAVSRASARRKAQGEREGLLASKEVIKHVRRSKLNKGDHNAGDTVATIAQYGISRDPEKAMRQLDEIEASIGRVHPDELPAGTVTDLANIRFLRQHPELFTDKHLWKAIDAYKKQAKEIEHSGRKKVLAVGDVYGIARPEERLEAGVKVGGRTVRARFAKDQDTLRRKEAELGDIRRDAQVAEAGVALKKGDERAKYERVAAEIRARAKSLERELRDYRTGFKQAEKDYVREAQATIREKGLEQPAYVKDVKPRQGLEPLPSFPGGRSARKQHMATMGNRRGVSFARDFETLVNQSIAEPRMRRAMHDATTEFAETWALPVGGKRYLTSEEINRAINRGELDESQYAVLHSQFFKQAILDPNITGEDFTGGLSAALKGEVKKRANDPGNKYVVVPKEALREFVHQMEPPKGADRIFGEANRFFSRLILGYSPAWAVAQVVAEGLPASFAIGANPARWARVAKYLAREDRRLGPKDRAAIDAMVGESAGVTPHPQIHFKPDTNIQASKFLRLSQRNRVGRALLKGAKGEALGSFDRWKGGKYRKAVAAAKADRELNSFVQSLSGLMRGQRSIVEAIKGKPLKEQMEYIAKHPAEAAKLEGYLDNVMGNWRALTRHEAKLAPLVVFYPFVRYSLRWTFWSFPKEHPVKATILTFLAQQNAEELEKLIGSPPSNWVEYATPIFTGSKGTDAALPGGTRIAPGTNALVTAIGKGKAEALASGLNPGIGVAGAAIYGVDSYTGEKVAETPAEHAFLALNALLSLPAPIRLAKLNRLGEGEQSVASKVYEGADPNRAARSFAFPFLPQSGEKFAEAQRFSQNMSQKYEDPIASIFDNPQVGEAIFGKDGKTVNWGLVKRLSREHKRSEEAGDKVTAVERPFFDTAESDGLTDEQLKALQLLQGGILVKPQPKKGGGQYGSGSGQYGSAAGQYSSGVGQYSSGTGQYGG